METLGEQHYQLAKLYGGLSLSERSEMELVIDCHWVTEVNLITTLGFYSLTSSIESMKRRKRAHALVIALSVEVFPDPYRPKKMIEGC